MKKPRRTETKSRTEMFKIKISITYLTLSPHPKFHLGAVTVSSSSSKLMEWSEGFIYIWPWWRLSVRWLNTANRKGGFWRVKMSLVKNNNNWQSGHDSNHHQDSTPTQPWCMVHVNRRFRNIFLIHNEQ